MDFFDPEAAPELKAGPRSYAEECDVPDISLPVAPKPGLVGRVKNAILELTLWFVFIVILCIGSLLAAGVMAWFGELLGRHG